MVTKIIKQTTKGLKIDDLDSIVCELEGKGKGYLEGLNLKYA